MGGYKRRPLCNEPTPSIPHWSVDLPLSRYSGNKLTGLCYAHLRKTESSGSYMFPIEESLELRKATKDCGVPNLVQVAYPDGELVPASESVSVIDGLQNEPSFGFGLPSQEYIISVHTPVGLWPITVAVPNPRVEHHQA